MNQILYTGKSGGPASIKSILKFFAISLIIFGVIFAGDGSYALYINYTITHAEGDTSVPEVKFEQEGNNAIVTVTHNKGISRVRYHWNDEPEKIIRGDSKETIMLDNISVPAGINTLHVSATDIQNRETAVSYEYAYDGICIELEPIDNSYVLITATDVTGLDHITYNFNSGEEITAYPDTEDTTIIKCKTEDIPVGESEITVTAINSNNLTQKVTKKVIGIRPPQIRLYTQGNDLIVMVSDDVGIDKIYQQINVEEPMEIDCGGAKEYSYRWDIADQDNILVTLTAVDVEGARRTLKGKNY